MSVPMLTIQCLQANGTWSIIARVAPWQDAEQTLANWRRWYPKATFRYVS